MSRPASVPFWLERWESDQADVIQRGTLVPVKGTCVIADLRCEDTEYSGPDQSRAVYRSGMWEQLRGQGRLGKQWGQRAEALTATRGGRREPTIVC